MSYCDFAALEHTPLSATLLTSSSFPTSSRAENFPAVLADYPEVPGPGSHPPAELDIRGHFRALIDELRGPEFRRRSSASSTSTFPAGRPCTPCAACARTDGAIHTDSKNKIITVLLYMNERWQEDAGRLRLLRGPDNLDDYVAEVPPYGGTLLAFRRADNSWHGHKPISGPATRHPAQLGHLARRWSTPSRTGTASRPS